MGYKEKNVSRENMGESRLLEQLEELAGRLGIRVRYENLQKMNPGMTGGLCKINGEFHLLVDRRTGRQERIGLFLGALKRFELNGIYMAPKLRSLLEESVAVGTVELMESKDPSGDPESGRTGGDERSGTADEPSEVSR